MRSQIFIGIINCDLSMNNNQLSPPFSSLHRSFQPQSHSLLSSHMKQSPKQIHLDHEDFYKSRSSLAQTTCDENSPNSQRFDDVALDEQPSSFNEFDLDSLSIQGVEETRCSDYFQNGFCMRGKRCQKQHNAACQEPKTNQKPRFGLMKVYQELPEILLICQRRTRSFLG